MNLQTLLKPLLVLALLLLSVALLYFGREFLIPIALSVLIAFLLAPLVWRLEKWRLGRVGSVMVATVLAFAVLGLLGYVVTGQLMDLAAKLPSYKDNLQAKIVSLRAPSSGPFAEAARTLKDLVAEVNKEAPTTATAPPQARTPAGEKPLPVTIVSGPDSPMETIRTYAAPILAPLGTAAIVIIFVIFMLLGREDLRDRIIHLMGRGQLNVTTQALNEAGERVSRYLVAQLIVNGTYAVPVAIGLFFIGVPNAILWGLLAGVLRFIPYIGPWIAAAFPIGLSLAVAPGWSMPLWTIGMFLAMELISNNVVEPWLYGTSTGLSPMAIIVAATFWTWVWGTVGLLLSTPLTVCILVLGKYIPSLTFLDVLLGDKPPIAAEDRFYQRLLAQDEDDLCIIAGEYAREHSVADAFARLIIPALRLADEDLHSGRLKDEEWRKMLALTRDLVSDLGDPPVPPAPPAGNATPSGAAAFCLPASDEADEVIGVMLARLLEAHGVRCEVLSPKRLISEAIERIEKSGSRLVCVSVLPPGSTRHALLSLKRLRERFTDARLVVGVWGEPVADAHQRLKRLSAAKPDALVTTLDEAVKEIAATAALVAPPSVAAAAGEAAVARREGTTPGPAE
jgi:predicted PurR-regulated permease PerM